MRILRWIRFKLVWRRSEERQWVKNFEKRADAFAESERRFFEYLRAKR